MLYFILPILHSLLKKLLKKSYIIARTNRDRVKVHKYLCGNKKRALAKAKVAENEKHRGAIKKFLVTPSLKQPWIGNVGNKNYLGNAERLNNLAMLSIENEIAKSIDFENILHNVQTKKQ